MFFFYLDKVLFVLFLSAQLPGQLSGTHGGNGARIDQFRRASPFHFWRLFRLIDVVGGDGAAPACKQFHHDTVEFIGQ